MDERFENEVLQAQKGNKEAFTSLISACRHSMYRVAISILHSTDLTGDAIQDTILKAYNSIHSLREPKYFKSWLIRILINQCNYILRQQRKVVPLTEVLEPSYASSFTSDLELREAILCLKKEYRIVIILFYFEDMPLKEISEVLEIPLGTVKNKLFRARNELANFLQVDEGSVNQHEQ